MMKKVTKKLALVFVTAMVMAMCLVGCGVDMGKMKGDWVVTTINGKSPADFAAENGVVEALVVKTVTITDDSASMSSLDGNSGEVVTLSGKIKQKSNGVEADMGGITWPFKLEDNGNISYKIDQNGTTYEYVFVKGTYDYKAKYAEQTGAAQQGGEEQQQEGGEAEGGEEGGEAAAE